MGAFFTSIPNKANLISDTILAAFGVFAVISLLFLFLKLNSIALAGSGKWADRFDDASEMIFAVSINGIIFVFGTTILVTIYNIDISAIQQTSAIVISISAAVVMSIIVEAVHKKLRKKQRQINFQRGESSAEIREELLDEIDTMISVISDDQPDSEVVSIYGDVRQQFEMLESEGVDSGELDELLNDIQSRSNIPEHIKVAMSSNIDDMKGRIGERKRERQSLEERLNELREERDRMVQERV